MNIPTNFKFVQPAPASTVNIRRSSAPRLLPGGGPQQRSGKASARLEKEEVTVNVDSKSHQRVMDSEKSTGMRMSVLAAGGSLGIPAEDVVGSPTMLDMNIMKQSGQVRRAIKREDSFDKLTRKIAKTLRQSSL